MRFQYSISHIPGKTMYMADTLSRALYMYQLQMIYVISDAEKFVQSIILALPASQDNLELYRVAQPYLLKTYRIL